MLKKRAPFQNHLSRFHSDFGELYESITLREDSPDLASQPTLGWDPRHFGSPISWKSRRCTSYRPSSACRTSLLNNQESPPCRHLEGDSTVLVPSHKQRPIVAEGLHRCHLGHRQAYNIHNIGAGTNLLWDFSGERPGEDDLAWTTLVAFLPPVEVSHAITITWPLPCNYKAMFCNIFRALDLSAYVTATIVEAGFRDGRSE